MNYCLPTIIIFNPERLNLLKKAKDEAAKEIEDYKKLSTEQFKEYRQVVGSAGRYWRWSEIF